MAMLKKTLLAAVTCGAIALTGSAFAQYGSSAGTGTEVSSSAGTTTHTVKHTGNLVHHAKFSGRSLAGINMREHAITDNLNRQQLGGSAAAVTAPVAGGRRASLDLSERQITANLNLQELGGATVALCQQQIIGP